MEIDKTYTQVELDEILTSKKGEWTTAEFTPVKTQLDTLTVEVEELRKLKPVEKTEKEIEIDNKTKELFAKEVALTLKELGLEDFAEILNVVDGDDMKEKVSKLVEVLNARSVDGSYKPNEHKNASHYTTAKSKGDAMGMIKALFGSGPK